MTSITPASSKSLSTRVAPDLFAFGFWILLAYVLKWQTRDLVWSLWLSSLVIGYLTILATLGAGAYIGWTLMKHGEFDRSKRTPFILMGGGAGLFLLAFFSLHFCGFHAGHSVFLNSFFPLPGAPEDGFGDAFVNPPLLWVMVFRHVMAPYGIFLIPALIAERHHLLAPMAKAYRFVRTIKDPDQLPAEIKARSGANPVMKDAMAGPYLNVIRMHCLIFFFAFCHFLKIDNFLVYIVVYSVYFFPWSEFKKRDSAAFPGKLGAVSVLAVLLLAASPAPAQEGKIPAVITDGLDVYKEKGAEAAIVSWLKGSPAEGQKNALSQGNVLLQIEAFYGAYKSFELINIKDVTSSSRIVYVQLTYEHGPVFAYFILFKKAEGWIITNFQFHTDPTAILPREYVS